MPQPLSSKERTLFQQVVKNYENKQYKKGLKAAEQVLRKVPNHGDTQAMKALILNSQSHPEEAFVLAKEALKNDMKSHICWHVYGLLWRSAKNFEEAIKAYKFALRLEPESQQIQRDLALLQIQMRDYAGYVQTRKAMLQARAGLRSNWTALAVAHHLAGELVEAERTLTAYEETIQSPPAKTDSEHAEAVLYKNTIIAEMGETERALEHLDATTKNNFDRQSIMEMRAGYLLKLGKKEEAAKVYRALLHRNAEYRLYYEGLQASLGLDTSDTQTMKDLYTHYAEKNPRGDAARRIPLDYYTGEEFRAGADHYLQRMLHKGVTSTFPNLKALYVDQQKRDTIRELVESYVNGTHIPLTNGASAKQSNGESSLFESSSLYFLAQHYNYHLSRDLPKAMSYIDRAVNLDPNSVYFHMTKARIWKHYGSSQKASETMEEARKLDKRDRYINTKAAKYQLRNEENAQALDTMSKFTRNETAGGPLGDLHDMQCMWFLTEDGESFLRQKKIGLALKRFHSIYNIFDVWQEDQFDFHSFSLRKGQIRAYIEMMRWEDHLRDHPFFSRAAIAAVKAYIFLHDDPQLGSLANGVNGIGSTDPNEAKKAAKKARKEKEKQDQIDAEKKDAKKTAGVGADGEPKKKDEDPMGVKLLETKEPLQDAMKFLTPLLEFSPKNEEAQRVGFEVFLRRKKYLLASRCLLASFALNPDDPTAHLQLIRLQQALNTLQTPLPPQIATVIKEEVLPIFPDRDPQPDLARFVNNWLTERRDDAPQVLAAVQAKYLLDTESRGENEKVLLEVLEREDTGLEDAVGVLEAVRGWNGDVESVLRKASGRWPEADAFREEETRED